MKPKTQNELLEKQLRREIQADVVAMLGYRRLANVSELSRATGLGRTTLYRLTGHVDADFPLSSLIVLADHCDYTVEVRLRRRK